MSYICLSGNHSCCEPAWIGVSKKKKATRRFSKSKSTSLGYFTEERNSSRKQGRWVVFIEVKVERRPLGYCGEGGRHRTIRVLLCLHSLCILVPRWWQFLVRFISYLLYNKSPQSLVAWYQVLIFFVSDEFWKTLVQWFWPQHSLEETLIKILAEAVVFWRCHRTGGPISRWLCDTLEALVPCWLLAWECSVLW